MGREWSPVGNDPGETFHATPTVGSGLSVQRNVEMRLEKTAIALGCFVPEFFPSTSQPTALACRSYH